MSIVIRSLRKVLFKISFKVVRCFNDSILFATLTNTVYYIVSTYSLIVKENAAHCVVDF